MLRHRLQQGAIIVHLHLSTRGPLGPTALRHVIINADQITLPGFHLRQVDDFRAKAINIVEIQTARYGPEGESTPLIIRGPGAGAQVTAGGVFGDVCKLGLALGADVKL